MTQTPPTPPPEPSVHLTWTDWLPYLEGSDATEAEKRQLIETLHTILLAFVDLGWEISPEKTPDSLDLTRILQAAVVYSEESKDTETEAL